MRGLLQLLGIAAFSVVLVAPSRVEAKKKKKPDVTQTVKKEKEKTPPPNDKSQNDGAQGRKNATEDAANDSVAPAFQRRP